jgi:hypothetical protein
MSYPDVVINDSVQISVHGVGQASTVGWVVLPVTIHAHDADGPVNVEMDVEWHVMRDFKPGLLLGLDTMLDYDIDLCLSDLKGTTQWIPVQPGCPISTFSVCACQNQPQSDSAGANGYRHTCHVSNGIRL